ncbi:membrane protein [Mesorhizobium sp. L-8-10]|uniref:VWA domain-containing protein n=1 Tax=unclassified Mesorhizobium TaxID=325217 RepID=UPI001925F00A|nr:MULTISPECIES: VWA domain-containing protein [unclassified Mesorhizobium]BCH20583.1 membrane protein [Mesorhizobium sp. L-8-3]BCH28430.1 membrane protein [Mesorhizobium sp. L-8-10]
MTEISFFLEAFHFLRPAWLLLVPAIAAIWFHVRRRAMRPAQATERIAPHLRKAMTVGGVQTRHLLAIDGVALGLLLTALGAAGPTWSRVPDPFVAQTVPLVVALKVTSSMTADDLAPTRLERAKQKIRDLLKLRAGGRTALVAYAGSAHSVVPMTDDPGVVEPYLQGLSPEIMPEDGADAGAALALARDILAREDVPGGILFVTDAVDTADVDALGNADVASLAVLAMLPEGANDPGIDRLSVPVVRATPDGGDVRTLERRLNAAYERVMTEEGTQPWNDRGWLLGWPAALLALLWFRRGWTMRWSLLLALGIGAMPSPPAHAEGVIDWLLTPDQQGRLAYQRKEYDRAAELFADPMWKGQSLYRDGQYSEAADVFSRLDTAAAAFAEGMAHIKGREYRDGIAAFETTLKRDPDYPGAAENLKTAKEILDYIETTREQSDTGEEAGEGADEIVMDNKDARGAETRIQGKGDALLTTEQWMNTVDTDPADFLRQRFAIEAATRQATTRQ